MFLAKPLHKEILLLHIDLQRYLDEIRVHKIFSRIHGPLGCIQLQTDQSIQEKILMTS